MGVCSMRVAQDAEYGSIFVVTYDGGALVGDCGQIRTKAPLDHESRPEYGFTLGARDPVRTGEDFVFENTCEFEEISGTLHRELEQA